MSSALPFANRLKTAREAKKLSQAELAKRAGLQASHVSHFETGRRAPSAENLRGLADALAVTTDYLLGREAYRGIAGPKFDLVAKHVERLSEAELDVLTAFAETLAERRRDNDRRGR